MHWVVSATYCWLLHKHVLSLASQPNRLEGLVTQVMAQAIAETNQPASAWREILPRNLQGKEACLAWRVAALAERTPAKRAVARVKRILTIGTIVKTERHKLRGRSKSLQLVCKREESNSGEELLRFPKRTSPTFIRRPYQG